MKVRGCWCLSTFSAVFHLYRDYVAFRREKFVPNLISLGNTDVSTCRRVSRVSSINISCFRLHLQFGDYNMTLLKINMPVFISNIWLAFLNHRILQLFMLRTCWSMINALKWGKFCADGWMLNYVLEGSNFGWLVGLVTQKKMIRPFNKGPYQVLLPT